MRGVLAVHALSGKVGRQLTTETTSRRRARRRPRPGLLGLLWRGMLWLALGFTALPLLLVPLYAVVDPVSLPMLVRQLRGERVVRQWQPIDAISDRLKAAVVMSEDGQFCRHWGVDVGALRDEVEKFLAGEAARGASTISMQVARNLFLWNDPSLVRKALEVPLALYLDLVLSKRRIMEIYLNIAEWGPDGEFGAAAGGRAAFGSDVEALSWRRAALLAVLLPNPLRRNAAAPSPGLRRVAGIVEARARQFGDRAGCLARAGRLSLE